MDNNKKFLQINEQIKHIEEKKGIEIDIKRKELCRFLLDYNYFNVINSSKILYAENRENGNHVYKNVKISNLILSYKEMNNLELQLLKKIKDIEIKLNSHIAFEISKRYKEGVLDRRIRNYYCDKVRTTKFKFKLEKWSDDDLCENAYKLVTNLSFGVSLMLLAKFDNAFRSKVGSVLALNYDEMRTAQTLRNYLAHNTPLLVALTNSRESDKRIGFLEKLDFNHEILQKVKYYNENCNGGHQYD